MKSKARGFDLHLYHDVECVTVKGASLPKPITRPLPGSTLVRILARVVTVRKTGGSIVVVIPAYLARTAGIEAGDKAEMKPIVDEDKGIVTGFSIEMRD